MNRHSDMDHNRSVFTIVGQPAAMQEALYGLISQARDLIDLRAQEGQHPRVGVVDVVPWVPFRDVTMEECVEESRKLGEKVGRRLGIPVFLYEKSSPRPERMKLETIRKGGRAGLETRMTHEPGWAPDFGPKSMHQTAGAVIVGARYFLIAFNVNLRSPDVRIAQRIAKTIRSSSGGLPSLKAIGVFLPSRGYVQVSMNLTDFRVTSLRAAFSAVEREALRYGVEVGESELVGMMPQAAWDEQLPGDLRIENWDSNLVLEVSCAEKGLFQV